MHPEKTTPRREYEARTTPLPVRGQVRLDSKTGPNILPGLVVSIQTFGPYAANLYHHLDFAAPPAVALVETN